MKAEEDFVNSLDQTTFQNVINAISERLMRHTDARAKKLDAMQVAINQCVSISALACVPAQGYYVPTTTQEAPQQKGQKEDAMSDLDTARRHMDTRLYGIKRAKRDALKTQFGLADLPSPDTFADMKARLMAGQFTLPEDGSEYAMDYGVSLNNLEWRDPSVKKDRPGFTAAEKLLDASATKVKDAIWVKTNPEDALAMLEAFESSTVN